MSLLVAPYNNGMRLGQGFNSYTHEICIDDAVVVNPTRAENILRNDGTTMRILAQQIGKPSVWRQMKEYIIDGEETMVDTETIMPDQEAGGQENGGIGDEAEQERLRKEKEEEKKVPEEQDPGSSIKRASEMLEETPSVVPTTTTNDPTAEGETKVTSTEIKPVETGLQEAKTDVKASANDAGSDKAASKTGDEMKPEVAAGTTVAEGKTTDAVPAAAIKAVDPKEVALQAQEAESKAKQDALNKKNLEEHNVKADATHAQFGRKEENMEVALKAKELELEAVEKARKQAFDVSAKHALQPWSAEQARGTSQIVSFTAKFIDKLSEITDDMNLSGALSITKSSFGVSGRGSYVNTDRFHDSDIKFYISVKVVNQSINFKDALEFCPVHSVPLTDQKLFDKTFGDSFISGFLEGGEFNALVTMKILNKAKKSDIQAEAKIAFTTSGGLKFDGSGNVALAKANISLNTQTHIQVSWCGGGSLKGYNQEWTIDSLLAAATRFPALVAQFPQRTYAILTKYNSLRSFLMLKPETLSPLRYESAALYTNQLMDIFMSYKSLYKNISADIMDIQNGVKRFSRPLSDAPPKVRSSTLISANLHFYSSTLEGLDLARHEVRRQMNAIAAEVHEITLKPSLATSETAGSNIVGCASFECLLPEIELKIGRSSSKPLTGQRINKPIGGLPDDVEESKEDSEEGLFDDSRTKLTLSADETSKVAQLERDYSWMAKVTKVTAPVGNVSKGVMFCTLDLAQIEPVIAEISVGRRSEHTGTTVGMLSVTYTNGLRYTVGGTMEEYIGETSQPGHTVETLKGLGNSERIISATIEVDAAFNETELSVVGLHFRTNKGRKLEAGSKLSPGRKLVPSDTMDLGIKLDLGTELDRGSELESGSEPKQSRGLFRTYRFDKAMTDGCLSGFWGRADAGPGEWGMERLGLVWSSVQATEGYFEAEDAVASDGGRLEVRDSLQEHKFAYQTTSLPQMIWSMNSISAPSNCLMAGVQVRNLDGTGFSYQMGEKIGEVKSKATVDKAPDSMPSLGMDWMVLPELQSCHIQEGHLQLRCKPAESSHSATVSFDMPFDDREEPIIRCWITGFDARPGPGERCSIRVANSRRTKTGFELTIKGDGLELQNVSVGWVAHKQQRSKSEPVKSVEAEEKPASAGKEGPDSKAQSPAVATAASQTESVLAKVDTVPGMVMTAGDEDFISGSMLWADCKTSSRQLQHTAFGPDDQLLRSFCGISELQWVAAEGFKVDFKIDKEKDNEIIITSPEDAKFEAVRMIWVCTAGFDE